MAEDSEAIFDGLKSCWGILKPFCGFWAVLRGFLKRLRSSLAFWGVLGRPETFLFFLIVSNNPESCEAFSDVLGCCCGLLEYFLTFWSVLKCFEMFWAVLFGSGRFLKVGEGFEALSDVLGCSNVFWSVLWHCVVFWGFLKHFSHSR